MNPFEMQTKLAQAWFDAATSMTASMTAAATSGLNPWSGFNPWAASLTPSSAFAAFWGPFNPLVPRSGDWVWPGAFGAPAASAWWQAPFPFAAADWTRGFRYTLPTTVWPFPQSTWVDFFPALKPFAAFTQPVASTPADIFKPLLSTASANADAIFASYRTASGHATAAILRAIDPRAGQARSLPWTPMTFAMPWM
jgi:hypothetical protein